MNRFFWTLKRSPLLRVPAVYLSRILYLNPQQQYVLVMSSAVVLLMCVASGALLFHFSDPKDLMERGKWLMKQGQAASAVEAFETLVEREPNNFEARLVLANAYLEIEERDKAAYEFKQASKLRANNPSDTGAHVAIARMQIKDQNFQDAEKQLNQAVEADKRNAKKRAFQETISELYLTWGDSFLQQNPPDYAAAYQKFLKGLELIETPELKTDLANKLARTSERYANAKSINKQYDESIAILKEGFRYAPSASKLLAIGALYEQKLDIDSAILWYSKLYEVEPDTIKDKLATLLVQKGSELKRFHQTEKAKQYYEDAKSINNELNTPLNIVFPVELQSLDLDYKFAGNFKSLKPKLTFQVKNVGSVPVEFLEVKTVFLAGDIPQGEVKQIVIKPNGDKLQPFGNQGDRKNITVNLDDSIPFESLQSPRLQAQVFVNYSQGTEKSWYKSQSTELPIVEYYKVKRRLTATKQPPPEERINRPEVNNPEPEEPAAEAPLPVAPVPATPQ